MNEGKNIYRKKPRNYAIRFSDVCHNLSQMRYYHNNNNHNNHNNN